jgi:uncharacterized protein (UPF0371 family)
MGVNMVGNCIVDDDVCKEASRQEIIRRYFTALTDRRNEKIGDDVVNKLDLLMQQNEIVATDRKCVNVAREKGAKIAGLGKRILRCETAPSFALACIVYETEL